MFFQFGTSFSLIFGISYLPGGRRDLLPGVCQVFTVFYFGMSRFQRELPTINLPERKWEKLLSSYYAILYISLNCFSLAILLPPNVHSGCLIWPFELVHSICCVRNLQNLTRGWDFLFLTREINAKSLKKQRKTMNNVWKVRTSMKSRAEVRI